MRAPHLSHRAGDNRYVTHIDIDVIGRVRRLLATAVVLNPGNPASKAGLSVRRYHGVGPMPQMILTGPVLDSTVMDAVKTVCLNTTRDPNGSGYQLGTALAELREN